MIIVSVSQFHVYLPCLALVGAFSVIVNTDGSQL